MKLLVLDQSTAATSKQEDQAIVGTAPEIIMAAIGQTTERTRIGSAGIMLPHCALQKVAEQFRGLEAIASGRVDLGLGRAPSSDGKTAYAFNSNAHEDAEHFPSNVRDSISWVSCLSLNDRHPFYELRAQLVSETPPEIGMLGTSDYGAQLAAYFGIPYCFDNFITDGRGAERALQIYGENCNPSDRYPKPIATQNKLK